MASVHQKQPVPNVAVSRFSLPVIFSATVAFGFVIEFVNAIDLFGFSRCAQEGEKYANDTRTVITPKTGDSVSNFRWSIRAI